MVECLPGMHEAQGSIPSNARNQTTFFKGKRKVCTRESDLLSFNMNTVN